MRKNYQGLADSDSYQGDASTDNDNGEDSYTVEQAIDSIGFGPFQLKLSLLCGLAWMADAMEMMILSILSPALHCDWGISSFQQALITTIVFSGMMLSSSLWGKMCDMYGRRAELIISSLFTFYFGLLSAFSPTFTWMLFLRFLVGFGIGGAPQSVTLYAEFLPTKQRARCVVLIEVFWAVGTAFEVLLALFVMPNLSWRYLLVFSAIPLLIFTLSCLWLPESVRYDMARGRHDLAQKTLERISKENNKPLPSGRLVINQSTTTNPSFEQKRGQLKQLFTPDFRKTTGLLWIIWFSSAFAYYGIVLMTTELFQIGSTCGEKAAESSDLRCLLECRELQTGDYVDLLWTTLAEFPGILVTLLVIELIGRKFTMAGEFAFFSLCILLLNICVSRTIMTMFLFTARAFISGAFQAAYVYTPEVYPTNVRALGLGTCSMWARCGAIITPFIAQVMLKSSSHLAVSVYGVVCMLAAVASVLLPYETRGKTLQESTDMPLR